MAFALAHNALNQIWYRSKAKRLPSKRFGYTRLLAHVGFVLVAISLLISSAVLSRSINTYGPINYDYWVRQAHQLSAYWLLIMVGIHLGRNWPKIVSLLAAKQPQWLQTIRIKPIEIGVTFDSLLLAGYGFVQLGIQHKLLMIPSLNMWDFANQAPEFLLLSGGVVFGFVTLTYQLTKKIH